MLPAPIDNSPEASALRPLFVYDRLAEPGFLANLLEHEVAISPATLDGFSLHPDGPADLPLALSDPEGSIEGRLVQGLQAEDYRRLDAYRGLAEGLYRRVELAVTTPAGPSAAFVFLPSARLRRLRRKPPIGPGTPSKPEETPGGE